ncbi:MAG: NADPH-dependent glutamate synthase beta subunit-like oxidoreductase/NAD(P)H-flavin reductase [Ulvibacter sp.]|jgi:NADPH-dependent glutamate synthase beta subunit-like oxidoreductase/NAD(P)H-flavin reductase
MKINYNLSFKDLYQIDGLKQIDRLFLDSLQKADDTLYQKLLKSRQNPDKIDSESELIILLSPFLEKFLTELFYLKNKILNLSNYKKTLSNLFLCKKLFLQKRVIRKFTNEEIENFDIEHITEQIQNRINNISELNIANDVMNLLEKEVENKKILDLYAKYSAWATLSKEGKLQNKDSILFNLPEKIEPQNLVHLQEDGGELSLDKKYLRDRDGFSLTDQGPSIAKTLNEAKYCIYCHKRNKDSCSKGLKNKDDNFKKSEHNIELSGCPLEQKISEMILLYNENLILSSLATIMIDNPLLPATGHRICNDCMKSCIYQNQTPVNIPEIETGVLKEVLNLDYGFEIYSLLSRWNPLNFRRFLPKNNTNNKILIVGSGPAGFNLAYHLLQEGHYITSIDGLKIEPLNPEISGIDFDKNPVNFKAIKDVESELFSDLSSRAPKGFGGVMEYGITVRWNKNLLNIVRIILERNRNFRLYGGVRFGSQINKEVAFDDLGFDHIALCAGAGSPNIISIKNNLSKGIRKASDFLMNLQLSGAFGKDSLSNLQIRLPAIIIGGGLTAIDSATEILSYYIVQIEKFAKRYDENLDFILNEEEKIIANEYLQHFQALKRERNLAKLENRTANLNKLLDEWGGVKILYRKSLQESPSYRLNHEEVKKAFEEGIKFIPNILPKEAILDQFNSVESLKTEDGKFFSAKTILIAAGIKPNIILSKEDSDFKLDNDHFQLINQDGQNQSKSGSLKAKKINILTYINKNKSVSFFGDMHPDFSGNVVKAMASAKKGYPLINEILPKNNNEINFKNFSQNLTDLLQAKIKEINRLTDDIIEIVIKAPLAAKNFKAGQFYRLQNYHYLAPKTNDTSLDMEPLAVTACQVNGDEISVIIIENGASSKISHKLKKDEEVILMGPTGSPTNIPKNKKILLIGGTIGNAALLSIATALKAANCQILYFAGYKKVTDCYKIKEIEKVTDQIIWSFEKLDNFKPNRDRDRVFEGNIIEAMEKHGNNTIIKLSEIDHIMAIGSNKMMEAVKIAKDTKFKNIIQNNVDFLSRTNSPMQCMMKQICAQCLQKQIDPKTGEEYFIYSCFKQDQDIDQVCFDHLSDRLSQNSLQEKIINNYFQGN